METITAIGAIILSLFIGVFLGIVIMCFLSVAKGN